MYCSAFTSAQRDVENSKPFPFLWFIVTPSFLMLVPCSNFPSTPTSQHTKQSARKIDYSEKQTNLAETHTHLKLGQLGSLNNNLRTILGLLWWAVASTEHSADMWNTGKWCLHAGTQGHKQGEETLFKTRGPVSFVIPFQSKKLLTSVCVCCCLWKVDSVIRIPLC